MIKPAPKVEAATAAPAEPQEAAIAERALESSIVKGVLKAPNVSQVHAEPPSEIGPIIDDAIESNSAEVQPPTMIESLRGSNKIIFDSDAAVISGQAEKGLFQRTFPRLFDERSYVSYGEVKRHIVVIEGNILVFADATDPSPLYTITLHNLHPIKEDPLNPHFRSHTVSPEANRGLPRANRGRDTLGTVLLTDVKGKIEFQITFDCLELGEDVVDKFLRSIELSKAKKEGK